MRRDAGKDAGSSIGSRRRREAGIACGVAARRPAVPTALALTLLFATVVLRATTTPAHAAIGAVRAAERDGGDTIVLADGARLVGVEIERLQAGRVFHRDLRGRRRWHEVDEVAVLEFARRPELRAAERALAAVGPDEADAALGRLLAALDAARAAEDDLAVTWIHWRLARVHHLRGEPVTAIAHLAEVVARTGESAWLARLPAPGPDDLAVAPPEALVEAQLAVDRARRRTGGGREERLEALARMLEGRLVALEREGRRPDAAGFGGPPRSRGVRIGIDAAAPPAGRPGSESTGNGPPSSPPPFAPAAPAPPVPPDEIDRLLDAGRIEEARAACRAALDAADAGGVPRLLHQHARALESAGEDRAALVRHLQAGLLHERSAWAAASLLAASILHERLGGDAEGTRRLCAEAVATGVRTGREDVAARARTRLETLDARAAEGSRPIRSEEDAP